MNLQIVETNDGLHSLYNEALNEHYHSTHGALQEANHVFIAAGFDFVSRDLSEISILEIGLGTGLNAFLTLLRAEENKHKVNYTGLELYPVPAELIEKLNYCEIIGVPRRKGDFNLLHNSPWNESVEITSNFNLTKLKTSVFDFNANQQFDLIYFDAFGFRAQEEMWGQQVFDKMFAALKPNGVLVTYSSKGEVRRRMQASRFTVEKLAGPSGKREMVRATKLEDRH